MELAKTGLGGVRIATELSREHGLNVCPGTIDHWIYGTRHPRLRNIFKELPSPALSYIIGANKGDGCAITKSGCVKLEVTDRDFAEIFNSRMVQLFGRENQNRILIRMFKGERLPLFIVKYSSKQLTGLLRSPIEKLLQLAFAFPYDFLRGFFDAEGYVSVCAARYLRLTVVAGNSNKMLLQRIGYLLRKELGIDSRIIRKRKAGTEKTIRETPFIMRRTSFSLLIGSIDNVKVYANKIGFSISRKVQKLEDALSIFGEVSPQKRSEAWKLLYLKMRGEWVKRASVVSRESKGIKEREDGVYPVGPVV